MKIGNLSPSALKQARLCEARLMAKREDEDYSESSGEPAKTGTLAHAAAQIWYRPNQAYLDALQQAKGQLAAYVRQLPADQQLMAWTNGLVQAKAAVATQVARYTLLPRIGSETDEQFTARLLDLTFKQAISEVDRVDCPDDPASVQDARELFGIIASMYPREKIDVVFAERRYKGTLGNGVPVHCILDLGIDRGGGVLEIVDYKTGNTTMSTEEMYSEDQVIMNLLAVGQEPALADYPKKRFIYFWVRSRHETGPVEMSAERLNDYEYWLSIKYQYLLNVTEPRETLNQYCSSCGRRMDCKEYRRTISEAMALDHVLEAKDLAGLSLDDLMAQFNRLKIQETLTSKSRVVISNMLLAELDRRNARGIEAERFKVTKQQRAETNFTVEELLAICQERGINAAKLLSVVGKRMKEAFADDPMALDRMYKAARVQLQTPFVLVREISDKKDRDHTLKVIAAQNQVEPRLAKPPKPGKEEGEQA